MVGLDLLPALDELAEGLLKALTHGAFDVVIGNFEETVEDRLRALAPEAVGDVAEEAGGDGRGGSTGAASEGGGGSGGEDLEGGEHESGGLRFYDRPCGGGLCGVGNEPQGGVSIR